MKKYYIYYPRNFANEYTVFSVKPEDATEFAKFEDDAKNDNNCDIQRLTRAEAEKRISAAWRKDWGLGKSEIVDFGAWSRGE